MSQDVVTNYFTKKRRGSYIQPSKRIKLSNETPSIEKVQTEQLLSQQITRQSKRQSARTKIQVLSRTRQSSRNAKKEWKTQKPPNSLDDFFSKNCDSLPQVDEEISLRLSPASSDDDFSELITAANDNHDTPETPSKKQKALSKRGRITPKKEGFKFKVQEVTQISTEFTSTKLKRKSARKKLISEEEPSSNDVSIQLGKNDAQKPTLKHNSVTIEKANTETNNVKENEDGTSQRMTRTRSRKNATSEVSAKSDSTKKSKKLAEKLLAKEKDAPDTLKEALKSSNNLKDLQETLLKMRDQKKKQQEKSKKVVKSKAKQPKEVAVVNKKREYAYETLHSLAQEVPKGLPLPYKYKMLAEMFRCADTVVGMLFNRQQVTTWTKLQKSVKEMVRKNFELEHLSQIKSVFPSAYQYRQEKGIISYSDHIRPSDFQLTVEPVLDERDPDHFVGDERKLTSGMMVKRRHHFLVQLINIVKDHHKKFLTTLNPPIEITDENILRWHPQFPLDKVPELKTSELPKNPTQEKERCHSAKDVLDKARSKFTKKAVDALKKVAEKASLTPEKSRQAMPIEENNNITPQKPTPPVGKPTTALKGVSHSLLAKIRAKEADKKLKSMVRSDQDSKKLQQLLKLPDVARALRMLFVTEKKAALPLEYICEKLVKCCTGILIPGVVNEHILLLIEHVPTWISQTKVRNISYVRMDKGKEMSAIVTEIQVKIREAEKK